MRDLYFSENTYGRKGEILFLGVRDMFGKISDRNYIEQIYLGFRCLLREYAMQGKTPLIKVMGLSDPSYAELFYLTTNVEPLKGLKSDLYDVEELYEMYLDNDRSTAAYRKSQLSYLNKNLEDLKMRLINTILSINEEYYRYPLVE